MPKAKERQNMNQEIDYVVLFKALADETRLKMVKMLVKEEKCPCHILKDLNISQPTLSYHTKILCEAGIIEGKRQGAIMECSVNVEKIKALKNLFDELDQILETRAVNEENSSRD